MTAALLLAAACALVACALLAVYVLDRRTGLSHLMRSSIVIHAADESIRGVLTETYRDGLILEKATLLTERGDVEMAGRVFVARDRIRYLQQP